MQIWAESGKSALPICNYSQILYQFLTFTQNLKRSRKSYKLFNNYVFSHQFFLNKLLNYKLYRIFYKVCILVALLFLDNIVYKSTFAHFTNAAPNWSNILLSSGSVIPFCLQTSFNSSLVSSEHLRASKITLAK